MRHFGALSAGVKPYEDERAEDSWCCYSDGVGELLVFCPECAVREFGTSKRAEG